MELSFSYTARLAIDTRKQTIVEELDKLRKEIDKFDVEKPEISMISINMKVENLNRLSIAVSTIKNLNRLHTEFGVDPVYGFAKESTIAAT
jgi:hypothetical protein